jgi:hypothetical protein
MNTPYPGQMLKEAGLDWTDCTQPIDCSPTDEKFYSGTQEYQQMCLQAQAYQTWECYQEPAPHVPANTGMMTDIFQYSAIMFTLMGLPLLAAGIIIGSMEIKKNKDKQI